MLEKKKNNKNKIMYIFIKNEKRKKRFTEKTFPTSYMILFPFD